MYAVQTYKGAVASNCKIPRRSFAKSQGHFAMTVFNPLKSFSILRIAKLLQSSERQSVAKLCKALCFQGCKALQSRIAKSHPYGGRPSVPPPVGLGRSPRCFGVAGKADFEGGTAQRVPIDGIPYWSMSAERM
ncbi:hypothetical protein ACVWZL_001303 [Bradyrhizobium sp. GM2.4]